jgi:uncharacterized protein YcbX
MPPLTVAELWRYPVKSMAGERVRRVELTSNGVAGDRIVQVHDANGRVVTSRTHPRLLKLRATLGEDGEPLVNGLHWRSPEVGALVEQAAGPSAHLTRFEGPERFDVLPLLVCTDGAIADFGRDARRLRPNIVISGVDGLAERTWEGKNLIVGDAVIALADLRGRCVMTTYDPDTNEQDRSVLRDIVHRFGGRLCLNARVLREGVAEDGSRLLLQ